jgi:hypothetical protein
MNFDIKIDYQPLTYFLIDKDNVSKIPDGSGIYYWIYYWDLSPFVNDENLFLLNLKKFYSKSLPSISSNFQNFKFTVSTSESFFTNKKNEDRLLGLGDEKIELLEDFISNGVDARKYINSFLKQILFQKPFYVGKADNLQRRLKEHFAGKTKILRKIQDLNFEHETIWIGYTVFDAQIISKELNEVFEEITQRILKPSFVERPG